MINNYYQLFTSLNSPTFAFTRLAFAHVSLTFISDSYKADNCSFWWNQLYKLCSLFHLFNIVKKIAALPIFFITRCQCGNRMEQILSLFSARKHFLRCGGHIHVFILLFLLCGHLFTGLCKSASCTCQGGTCLYCFPQFLISIPASLANKMLTMHQR